MWRYVLIAGVVFAGSVGPLRAADDARRPNVLFIAIDDLNHWVGHLKRHPQAKTPNIDRLAARGVTFTRAYCAAPACNPSRAALMSGMRPGTTGVYDNAVPFGPRIDADLTLTTTFRKAGYFVCGAGKIFHGSRARPEEWDHYYRGGAGPNPPPRKRGTPAAAGNFDITPLENDDDAMPDFKFVDYAIEQLRKKHDKPFFLAVGLTKPHLPWNVPKKYYDLFPLDKLELPPFRNEDLDDVPPLGQQITRALGDHAAIVKGDKDDWKRAIQAYLACIAFADAQVGRILDDLDKSPYASNTVICLWGDHGWHLGEKQHWRKFTLWEEATRAPLVWVVPGVTKAGGRCERTVDFMSIYSTLCDVCGVAIPKHVEGPSYKALLADPKAVWDRPAITTHGFQNHAVRSEGWRYIRYADGSEELYDETNDPYEWVNLASRAEHAGVKTTLAGHLPTTNQPRPKIEPRKQKPKPAE